MNDPSMYSKTCEIPKIDGKRAFDNYLQLMNWQDEDNILDVGAGDGTVTLDILVPRIPINFKSLVLLDVSEKMVNFAKQRNKNKKISVIQKDITSPIPNKFREHFHHIFSLYCLNYVGEEASQKRALENIFDMLKPGGDVLLTIVANTPYFGVWENLAKSDKWSPYMQDFRRYIGPYNFTENPSRMLKKYLETAGFVVDVCKFEKRCYVFRSMKEFMGFAMSVSVFVKRIPESKLADYYEDMEKELRRSNLLVFEKCESGEERVYQHYRTLTAYASKFE